MFPDSNIAEKFCLQKVKCTYFINYVIALHFPSILMNNVKDSEFYAISFDGSLHRHPDGTDGSCCKCLGQCCKQSVHLLSWLNFHSWCTTPRSFWVFHFSINFIESKKAAASIYGWHQCELDLFLHVTIGQKMTWVSYFQLDHAVSMLFMELSKLESRAQIGNSNKFWEPGIKFCMTHQLGEIITLISLEVVDFLFHFVVHGSKMKR